MLILHDSHIDLMVDHEIHEINQGALQSSAGWKNTH